jgi:hypothetical protein
MQRLEQIRLAGAVGSDREHEPGLEAELEVRVGAELAERERPDDQPGLSRRGGSA